MNILVRLWSGEPVRVATYLAAAAVFVAAKLGVVVDQQSVVDAILYVVPILLAGEVGRSQVTPVGDSA